MVPANGSCWNAGPLPALEQTKDHTLTEPPPAQAARPATAQFAAGVNALALDGAWASATGALASGVVVVGFALELGAGAAAVGLLAALPFFAHLAQLPAVALVERLRRRRTIAVGAITASRVVILLLAAAPLLLPGPAALWALVAGQALIALLVAVGSCAWNSWVHDFLRAADLGRIFARRLALSTAFALAASVLASVVLGAWPQDRKLAAFSVLFFLGAWAGFLSSAFLARVPDAPMAQTEPFSYRRSLAEPLRDINFRRLILFVATWSFANNLAAPFFAVYLIAQVGLDLSMVVILSVISQIANIATLSIWGRISDRYSNKSILQVAAPVSLAGILALVFAEAPQSLALRLALLALLHLVMGAAAAGVALANGNIALKLAPAGRATGYLAALGVAGALASGVAPLIGGGLADWFAAREFRLSLAWVAPGRVVETPLLALRHWQFFFALAVGAGLFALHRLSLVREEGTVEQRIVVAEFMLAARQAVRNLSSVGGAADRGDVSAHAAATGRTRRRNAERGADR